MKRRGIDPKAAQLRTVALFSDCEDDELVAIARLGDLATVPAGRVLVSRGRPGSQFLVIVDGNAVVTRGGTTLATLTSGDFFGEMSLLNRQYCSATVTAASTLSVLAFHPASFAELLRQVPRLAECVERVAAGRTLIARRTLATAGA